MWEPLNAVIIVLTVAASEIFNSTYRKRIAQGSIAAVSILLHLIVRPYADEAGNFVVILFACCELLGVIGADEDTAIQWAHISMLMLAIVVMIRFTVFDFVEEVRRKREEIRMGKRRLLEYKM